MESISCLKQTQIRSHIHEDLIDIRETALLTNFTKDNRIMPDKDLADFNPECTKHPNGSIGLAIEYGI